MESGSVNVCGVRVGAVNSSTLVQVLTDLCRYVDSTLYTPLLDSLHCRESSRGVKLCNSI